MQDVSTWIAARQRDETKGFPWRGLGGATVLALSLSAFFLPPAISLLIVVGVVR